MKEEDLLHLSKTRTDRQAYAFNLFYKSHLVGTCELSQKCFSYRVATQVGNWQLLRVTQKTLTDITWVRSDHTAARRATSSVSVRSSSGIHGRNRGRTISTQIVLGRSVKVSVRKRSAYRTLCRQPQTASGRHAISVSYTHLTLPTILRV